MLDGEGSAKIHQGYVAFARPSHSRPAMAGGIYSANLWKCAVVGLDSRFRGNHRGLERIPIPNDTTTQNLVVGQFDVEAALRRHLPR